MSDTAPAGPLAGVRVLDLSRVLAGPWTTQLLGDLGATVFKVERPGRGDDTREWGPPWLPGGGPAARDGLRDGAYFACANRNKRALAIDFGEADGAALLRDLAATCDIVVENFRTGTLAKYGLDHASLAAENPALVYCSITGFGQTGPYAERGGYDFLIQGMAGLMSLTGLPDGEDGAGPVKAGIPAADLFTGMYAATSILAALNHARATGQGQHIDAALMQTQIAVLGNHWSNYLNAGVVGGRMGNAHATVVPYRDFQAADGRIIVACGNDGQFAKFCTLLGHPEWAEDDRFRTNGARSENRPVLEALLGGEIARHGAAALLSDMRAAGVPGGPINDLEAVFADPHVRASGIVASAPRADGTEVKVVGYPHRLSATPASVRTAPPLLGQDTRGVLMDELGLSDERLEDLRKRNVIAF
ncbi:MAG: CaiB/BaiF CoA-transferase family protein [Pseudomonadota bacterium]